MKSIIQVLDILMLNRWQALSFFFFFFRRPLIFSSFIFYEEIFHFCLGRHSILWLMCVCQPFKDRFPFWSPFSISYFSRSGLCFHWGGKNWMLTVHILLGEVQVMSVVLLLCSALLPSLDLCFVHLCFPSLLYVSLLCSCSETQCCKG